MRFSGSLSFELVLLVGKRLYLWLCTLDWVLFGFSAVLFTFFLDVSLLQRGVLLVIAVELDLVLDISVDLYKFEVFVFALLIIGVEDVPLQYIFGLLHRPQQQQTAPVILVSLHLPSLTDQLLEQLADGFLVSHCPHLHLDPEGVVISEYLLHLLRGRTHPRLFNQGSDLISEETHLGCPAFVVRFGQGLVEEMAVYSAGQEAEVFELNLSAVVAQPDGDLVFFDQHFLITAVQLLQFEQVRFEQLSVVEDHPSQKPYLVPFRRQLLHPRQVRLLVDPALVQRLEVYQRLFHVHLTAEIVVELLRLLLPPGLGLEVQLAILLQQTRLGLPQLVLVPDQIEVVVGQPQFSLERGTNFHHVVLLPVYLSDQSEEGGGVGAVLEQGNTLFEYTEDEALPQGLGFVHFDHCFSDEGGDLQVMSVFECQQDELDVCSRELLLGESFFAFCQPEVFLHDEVFVDLLADDVIDGLVVVVLFVQAQQFEPVDQFVVAACDGFLFDQDRPLDKDVLHFLRNHLRSYKDINQTRRAIPTSGAFSGAGPTGIGWGYCFWLATSIRKCKLQVQFFLMGRCKAHQPSQFNYQILTSSRTTMEISIKAKADQSAEVAQEDENAHFDPVPEIQLVYEQIRVNARVKQEEEINGKTVEVEGIKQILKSCTGRFNPGTFTAILGPSGCGKTTMLNLISGRQMSENLDCIGNLRINGQSTKSIGRYKSYIGYVMQEDNMLPTFTPEEAFKFVTDLRLPDLSEEEKDKRVNLTIKNLGLEKCRNTWIGDTRIRGVSGGEKKRTSIGLELLINPSIIFLDEPTTGLDSTTSLNLIRFLNKLASNGRTVISTIHQPSSEIFMEFHHIMLMVEGHIIYDGQAMESMGYFSKIGHPVPRHTNPTDHYMKMMNKEGLLLTKIENKEDFTEESIKQEFEEVVDSLVQNYRKHKDEDRKEKPYLDTELVIKEEHDASWCTQFWTIFKRNWVNQFRQPLDVILKVAQSIFFGVICIVLYYQEGTTLNELIQNNQGCIFFIVMSTGFGMVFASVNLFNFERPVFIRERLSNTYSTSAYYLGRTVAVFPIEIITNFLFIVIAYFPCNLTNTASVFFKSALSLALCAFMSSSFGLLLSTLFSDAGVVMALVPVLIIPFLLVGGFFVPLETVPKVFYPFEYLSMFRYGFEGMIYSQYEDNPLIFNGQSYNLIGTNYNFQTSWSVVLILMAAIGLGIRLLALFVMYMISNPKIIDLKDEEDASTLKMRRFTSKKIGEQHPNPPIEAPPGSTEKIRVTSP